MDTFEQFRPQLFSLAYRMMGTRADAEDIVQEAFLRWQSADQAAVRTPRSFLNSVVARLSLDALKSARRKRETYVGTWLPEPISMAVIPEVEMADSLSMAFLHVLETLSPQERVAFLMRDVFAAEYAEIAEVLDTSPANARQLVTRARQRIHEKRPPRKRKVDPEQYRLVLREFLAACASDDKTTLMGLLRDDAVLYSDGGGKAAAALNPIWGADKVARFFLGVRDKQPVGIQVAEADAGGVPALRFFVDSTAANSLLTLDLDDAGRIEAIYVIRNPDKLTAYGPTMRH